MFDVLRYTIKTHTAMHVLHHNYSVTNCAVAVKMRIITSMSNMSSQVMSDPKVKYSPDLVIRVICYAKLNLLQCTVNECSHYHTQFKCIV